MHRKSIANSAFAKITSISPSASAAAPISTACARSRAVKRKSQGDSRVPATRATARKPTVRSTSHAASHGPPALVAACVAVVVHPEDGRWRDVVGSEVLTPLFDVAVPVVVHPLADPEKGTGAAMICTFGDSTDVVWWRELDLPTRNIVTRSGRITEAPPPGVPDGDAWRAIAGRTVKQAQRAMVELLAASGDMVGDPRPITHPVKFYERGERPLEIVTSRQWFIRNGGRDDALRRALLGRGGQLDWHPPYMQVRFDYWVSGLNGDWLVSRQRFFGVPVPVWYPVGPDGEADHTSPIVPDESTLPVDPTRAMTWPRATLSPRLTSI